MGAAVATGERDGFGEDAQLARRAALVESLCQRGERWGWQHEQPLVTTSEFTQPEPTWAEPDTSTIERYRGWRRNAWKGSARRTGVGLALIGGGLLAPSLFPHPGVWGSVSVAAGAVITTGPFLGPSALIWSVRARNSLLRRRFRKSHDEWEAAQRDHAEDQLRRQALPGMWGPLRPEAETPTMRVDVWGGTGDSWASLITTMGSSLLAEGGRIAVMDFSEQQVGGGLAMVAHHLGHSVTHADLPTDLGQVDPLENLTASGAAQLITEAVNILPTNGTRVDQRALHHQLLSAVTEALGDDLTWSRLVAGLLVLRRVHTLTPEALPLSPQEIRTIATKIDFLHATTDRVSEQLQILTGRLAPLAKREIESGRARTQSTTTAVPLWPPRGLTVVATGDTQDGTKELLDALLVQRLIIDLTVDKGRSGPAVLVLAGADHLGLTTLKTLGKKARANDVRLVLLLSTLRDDLGKMLGAAPNGSTIIMRLGNAQDAMAAAELIGRDHKFVLSQITRSVGTSFSRAQSTSTGHSDSVGRSEGSSAGKSREAFAAMAGGHSTTKQDSVTTSRAQTWQDTVSTTAGESDTIGASRSRVYEFQVEPVTIQSLPTTAFILVEHCPQGRRVVAGDCNPGIGLLAQSRFVPEPGEWL
jgi:hypothetical protein